MRTTERRRKAAGFPLPREHGAWAMVLAPALAGLSLGGPGWIDGTLLLVALLGAFCAQYVVVRILTVQRPEATLRPAGLLYFALTFGSGALLLARGHAELLGPAVLAVIYFLAHLYMVRRPSRREHRGLGFETLTVAVLCLGTVAGAIVGGFPAETPEWRADLRAELAGWSPTAVVATTYGAAFAFFVGSVFHVRALVRRLKSKTTEVTGARRWQLARESILWHFSLVALGGTVGVAAPDLLGRYALAFAPAVLRAFWTVAALGKPTWSLKQIGLIELACTVTWLAGCWRWPLDG